MTTLSHRKRFRTDESWLVLFVCGSVGIVPNFAAVAQPSVTAIGHVALTAVAHEAAIVGFLILLGMGYAPPAESPPPFRPRNSSLSWGRLAAISALRPRKRAISTRGSCGLGGGANSIHNSAIEREELGEMIVHGTDRRGRSDGPAPIMAARGPS